MITARASPVSSTPIGAGSRFSVAWKALDTHSHCAKQIVWCLDLSNNDLLKEEQQLSSSDEC